MIKILKAVEYGKVQLGKDKDGSFIYKQGKAWMSRTLLETYIYLEIGVLGVLGLLEPTN